MEDSSLEELLANVNALSIKQNWSGLVVDCEVILLIFFSTLYRDFC